MQHGNTVRCVHSRSLQSNILARRRCHYGDCSAFRSLELGMCHWPLQAALSGSIIKAPGFAGGYLLMASSEAATTAASSAFWPSSRVTECRAALGLTDRDRLDIEPVGSRTVERVLTGSLPGLIRISPASHPVAHPRPSNLVHFGCWTRFAADTFGKVSHFATTSGGRLAAFRGPFVCWPMSKTSSASPHARACGSHRSPRVACLLPRPTLAATTDNKGA